MRTDLQKRAHWVRLVTFLAIVTAAFHAGSTGSLDAGGVGGAHVRSDVAHVRVHAALGLGLTPYPDRRR